MPRQIALMNYAEIETFPPKPIVTFRHVFEGGSEDVSPNYRHGAKYGNGGFTGQRCMLHRDGPYTGQRVMFRLDDHINRLLETIAALEWMTIPWTRDGLKEAMFRLMVANPDDDYLSLVFASGGDVGVMPEGRQPEHHVFINTRDFDPVRHPYLGAEAMVNGMTVRLTELDVRRRPPGKLARAKVSANYLDSNVAKHRALKAGCKDALLLDYTGDHLAELSVSNVIGLFDMTLISPDASSGALDGITKQTTQTIAYEVHGYPTTEQPISLKMLKDMRMMIACGTAIGDVRVNRIVNPDGSVLWEQSNDPEAIKTANTLCTDIWRVKRGGIPDFHPEWFEPIPQEYLRP